MSHHRRLVLAILVAASIATRLIYFLELNGTPFIRMDRWRQTDMHYYDGWALQIAAGDWRSASLRLPMHRWHREVAARSFADHPEAKPALDAEAARRGPGVDAAEVLWSRWLRVPQFYQDPLYAYAIAASYALGRADPRIVLALQLAVGVLTNLLIWVLARRFVGDLVAACAAALAVLCAPLMFYELLLLRDSLIVFTGLALIWLLDRALERGWIWSALLGVALGAACLLKSTFLLVAVIVIALLFVRARRGERPDVARAVAAAVGLVVAFGPGVARNLSVGVSPLALASSGPLTLVSSNDVRALPDVGFGIDIPELAAFLGTTDGGWRSAIGRALGSHSLASFTTMVWRKWDRVWHWFEIPNNEDFYYMRLKAPVLAWLPVTFWLISPLALVGLVLGASRWRAIWPLYLLAAVSAAPLVLFYVLGRFRVALLAAVLPFAALTIVEIAVALRARRYARGLALAAAVLGVSAWTGRPLASDQRLIRTADWILPWSVVYESKVYDALDVRDPVRAGAAYLEFFQYEPTEDQIRAAEDPQLAPELADMHTECAQILRLAGQPALADAHLQRAHDLLSLH